MLITSHRFTLAAFFTILSLALPVQAQMPVNEQTLEPSDQIINQFFGWRVAVDGNTVVVGAPRNRQSGNRAGAAFVYQRNTGAIDCPETGTPDTWCEDATLLPFECFNSDCRNQRAGSQVAVSGNTIVVGASRDGTKGSNAGAVLTYTKENGVWTEDQKLLASDGAGFDFFGNNMAISGDTLLVTGGSNEDGKVYAFERSGNGIWSEHAILRPSDAGGLVKGFGASHISLSGDTLTVGAPADETNGVEEITDPDGNVLFTRGAGAAYVFTRTNGVWSQEAKLLPLDGAPGDNFGQSTAVFGDSVLIGAPRDDENADNSGSAYLFTRSNGVWTQQAKFVGPGGGVDDVFGFVVALFGNIALIPADLEDAGGLIDSGAVYVYRGSGPDWTESATITLGDDALAYDVLGWGVALDGDTAVLGAPTSTFNWTDRPGSTYIFDLNSGETPTGIDVEVSAVPVDSNGDPVEDLPSIDMSFETVANGGETTVTVADDGPPPPDGFKLTGLGGGATYLDIETSADFGGEVEICIDYSELNVAGNAANLAFYHYEELSTDVFGWVDITSSNDLENEILCGITTSFSFFAVMETEDPVDLIVQLVDAVATLNASKGIINSLDAKLDAVQQALDDSSQNNDVAALNVLMSAFINAVEAQRGKKLTQDEADDLVGRAEEIALVLSIAVL